jgi:hypothetical protein
MVEIEINVRDDFRRTGEIIQWLIVSGAMHGRIVYDGTDFRTSRFRFSSLIDAIYFKLAWG